MKRKLPVGGTCTLLRALADGSMTARQLSRMAGVQEPTVQRVLDRLQQRGFVDQKFSTPFAWYLTSGRGHGAANRCRRK